MLIIFRKMLHSVRDEYAKAFVRCLSRADSLQYSHDEITHDHPRRLIVPHSCDGHGHLRNAASARSDSHAVAITTACRLRPSMGRKDSDAGQGRIERDVVFAKNAGWIAAEDAGDLHSHALYFRHLSCTRGVLRITRLRVRACRCSRSRKLGRRIRAVCK